MKTLFDRAAAYEIKKRVQRLDAYSRAQWGRMNPAQALAHLSLGLQIALGDIRPPRTLIGRLVVRFAKRGAFGDDSPMRRNTPTVPGQEVRDERVFAVERHRLLTMIDRFVDAGPGGCTTHPHAFFGPLTPNEWALLMYKHLDHHLRQFGG